MESEDTEALVLCILIHLAPGVSTVWHIMQMCCSEITLLLAVQRHVPLY